MTARLRILLPAFIVTAGLLRAQSPPKKIFGEKPPAERLVGVWQEHTSTGEQYATFTADGRLIFKVGFKETKMTWKLDATSTPWKLELASSDDPPAIIYTVIEITAAGEFRMAVPALDRAKIPGAEELKKGQMMKRVTLESDAGIHQVVAAHLKGLAGNWEIKEGKEAAELTITADGTWRMKSPGGEDKGRFRIDVTKTPCTLDLLSTEGQGPTYTLYELKPGESLRLGRAGKTPAERPAEFGPGDALFTRKKP